MTDERMRELIDFVFGRRLKEFRSRSELSNKRKRERVEEGDVDTEGKVTKRARRESSLASIEVPLSTLSPTKYYQEVLRVIKKRQRYEEPVVDDTDNEDEELPQRKFARLKDETPSSSRWLPKHGEIPLLGWLPPSSPPTPYDAIKNMVRPITLTFEGKSTTFWSHSNERNAHPRMKDVFFVGGFDFPDDHYYIVDGIRGGYISVSTFLHRFFPDFNSNRDLFASYCLRATRPDSPYYGMKDVQEVFDLWDKIRDNGTCYHAAIDDTLQGRPLRPVYRVGKSDAIGGPPRGFLRFMTDHPELEVYFTEFTVFDRDLMLVGQFDALFWDRKRQCFVLVDWKNVRNFRVSATQKGTHPLTEKLDDCHLSHYTLQLNLYRVLLERRYGIVIEEMWIVNFPAFRQVTEAVYERYPVPRLNMNPFLALCPITEEGRARRVWAPSEPCLPCVS